MAWPSGGSGDGSNNCLHTVPVHLDTAAAAAAADGSPDAAAAADTGHEYFVESAVLGLLQTAPSPHLQ